MAGMAVMAGYCWKWLDMARNCYEWLVWLELVGYDWNDQEWLEWLTAVFSYKLLVNDYATSF